MKSAMVGTAIQALSTANRLPVLIVGGGVGGFTAALSLHRAGIQNNLIMKETKFTQNARSGVFLGRSAVRILDRLGLGSQYRALGTPLHKIQIQDLRGKEVMCFDLDKMGTEVWTVPRANLLQILLESIPPDSVHFGTKFRGLHVDGDSVHVKMQDVTNGLDSNDKTHSSVMEANFVIGADGHNSSVRTFMSRPAMTLPSGTTMWKAIVPNSNVDDYPLHFGQEIWGVNKRFGFARMNPEEVVWWAVLSDCPKVLLRPFTPILLKEFDEFPKLAADLISSANSDRDIHRIVMKRVWPEQFPWVDHTSSKIALVGNAGRPGDFGQFHGGHTFAVEDGYFLACNLAEHKEKRVLSSSLSLEAYEENREARMAVTRLYSHRFDRLSLSQSPARRYFARKLLQFSVQRMALNGEAAGTPLTNARNGED